MLRYAKLEVPVVIQVYSPGNENYEMNGDMTLFPIACEATSELNGTWMLEITHPIDDEERWRYIKNEAVLSVATFMGEKQLYRIANITDKNDQEITAKAYPIFFDSADDCFLMDVRPEEKTGQEALDIMTEGSRYSAESDIDKKTTAYFIRRNLMDAIGGDSPSFIDMWGGEPLYTNYKIILNAHAGVDRGTEIRYGKNTEKISVSEDMSEVTTRIVPLAYNGHKYSKEYIDSPLIDNYAKIYTKEISFDDVKMKEDAQEDDDKNGIIVCNDQEELDVVLEQKCREQFEAGIDLFKVSIEIDLIELENTEEYKDFESLVRIGLGDTVHCFNSRLGVATKARAVKIVWDCMENKVKSVILGEYQHDLLTGLTSNVSKIEKQVKVSEIMINGQKVVVKTFTTLRKIKLSSEPEKIVSFNYAGVEDATPIFLATIPLTMDVDGNVVFEYRIDGVTLEKERLTKYLERGNHFVTLTNYFSVDKGGRGTLTVYAYTEYFASDNRSHEAKINSIIEYIESGEYTELSVDQRIPIATIPENGIKAILFAQGLAGTERWDGTITLKDVVPKAIIYDKTVKVRSLSDDDAKIAMNTNIKKSIISDSISLISIAKEKEVLGMFDNFTGLGIINTQQTASFETNEYTTITGDTIMLNQSYIYKSTEEPIDNGRMCSVTIRTDDKASVEGVMITNG